MLTTVPIEELKSGDLLPDDIGAPLDDAERNARTMIRDAMAVPTHVRNLYQSARTVREVRTVGKMYVSVTMGTYAVVRLRKGSPVSVYRKGSNGAQESAPAVLDVLPTEPDDIPYGPERQPFNYVRSQLRKLGNSGPYSVKVRSKTGETKWLEIHPDDLPQLTKFLVSMEEAREQLKDS